MSNSRNTFVFVLMGALGFSAAVGASSFSFKTFLERNDFSFFQNVSAKAAKGVNFDSIGPAIAAEATPASFPKHGGKRRFGNASPVSFLAELDRDELPSKQVLADLNIQKLVGEGGLIDLPVKPKPRFASTGKPRDAFLNILERSAQRKASAPQARRLSGGFPTGATSSSGPINFDSSETEGEQLLLASSSAAQGKESEQIISAVPLPASGLMLLAAALGMGAYSRRKSKG